MPGTVLSAGDTAEDKINMHGLLDLNSKAERWTTNKIKN